MCILYMGNFFTISFAVDEVNCRLETKYRLGNGLGGIWCRGGSQFTLFSCKLILTCVLLSIVELQGIIYLSI